ncbi:MAG: hypothetical protein RJA22_1277 [Verrucomicrobiota bacterium]
MQRLARQHQRAGTPVALVPTMGCLHEGHLSLVRRARQAVGPRGRVVVSIYVNPTQFGPSEDLRRYPRTLAQDLRRCRAAGVDVVFAPKEGSMFTEDPRAPHSTWVTEELLARDLEGAARPTHFRGVTTVVAKLFLIVQPQATVFGAKDWQQAAIVRRMIRDLNFPIRFILAPTIREPDGLAMSSRNRYLTGPLRTQATVLSRALALARRRVRAARAGLPAAGLRRELARLIAREPDARMDYVSFIDPDTLQAVPRVRRGTHLALAVRVGPARLIDNGRL